MSSADRASSGVPGRTEAAGGLVSCAGSRGACSELQPQTSATSATRTARRGHGTGGEGSCNRFAIVSFVERDSRRAGDLPDSRVSFVHGYGDLMGPTTITTRVAVMANR